MSENEETGWRLSVETGQEEKERAAGPLAEDEKQEEELQQKVQAKAEDIAGGGEASLVTKPEEVPIIEPTKQGRKVMKKSLKARAATRKKESNNNLATISKQLEKQANDLVRIEKLIQPLQKSFNKIDKQSNTIKQLYTILTQLQRQMHHRQFQQQRQSTQKKRWSKVLCSGSSRRLELGCFHLCHIYGII
jgi:hypothetical protein